MRIDDWSASRQVSTRRVMMSRIESTESCMFTEVDMSNSDVISPRRERRISSFMRERNRSPRTFAISRCLSSM